MKKISVYKAIIFTALLISTVFAARENVAAAAPANDNLANPATIAFDGLNPAEFDFSNAEASREAGEMLHYNQSYPGEKTVWYKWTPAADTSVQIEVTAPLFNSLVKVYKTTAQNPGFQDLTTVVDNLSVFNFHPQKNVVRLRARVGTTYYVVVGSDNLNQPATEGQFHLKVSRNKLKYSANLGVRVTDTASLGIYRPGEGRWYVLDDFDDPSPTYYKFGQSGGTPDEPIVADFDGDSFSDLGVTRNQNGLKYWYVTNRFSSVQNTTTQWGLQTDEISTGDFDLDGRADLVAIRNNGQNLVWYVRQSRLDDLRVFTFGLGGDRPVAGDFDGDGATDVAVTRLVNGSLTWHILKSGFAANPNATYTEYVSAVLGAGNDTPAMEDFDGDGKTDLAVFRPVNGNWLILRSGTGELQETHFGQLLDKTQPADYDGDGKADLAVFRPSEGRWYFWFSGTDTQSFRNWGTSSDIPVASMNTLSQ